MDSSTPVLALVRDLLLSSRVTAGARQSERSVLVVRDPADLPARSGSLLIADLNLPGAVEAAANWKQAQGGQVIGFVSHTDAATIARAREAGIDRVIARGRFFELLPDLLKGSDVPE